MNPNVDQLMSIARWLLSAGGPASSLLIARGIPADKVTGFTTALLTILGALPPLISFIWGLKAHTEDSKLKAVEAMDDVDKVIITPKVVDGAATAATQAASNSERPKVVT